MPKSRVIIVFGVLIALLPVLGFPHSWEAFFQVLAGLSIVLLSVWANIDRKLKLQAKAHQRQARKDVELGKRVTDFYPKTGQSGRRLTDLKPNVYEEQEQPPEEDGSAPKEPEL